MPAYAKDGKIVCFFQAAAKFKSRYATLGFSDSANLDEGTMWPTSFALKKLTAAEIVILQSLIFFRIMRVIMIERNKTVKNAGYRIVCDPSVFPKKIEWNRYPVHVFRWYGSGGKMTTRVKQGKIGTGSILRKVKTTKKMKK